VALVWERIFSLLNLSLFICQSTDKTDSLFNTRTWALLPSRGLVAMYPPSVYIYNGGQKGGY